MKIRSLQSRANRQEGLSLIEAIAFLGIAAVVVVGALALYRSATLEQQATQATTEYQSIRTVIRALYQGNYPDDMTNVLISSGRLPSTLTVITSNNTSNNTSNTTSIRNVFGGTVTVGGNTSPSTGNPANTRFRISYSNVPREVCISLLLNMSYSRDWLAYEIGGQSSSVPIGTSPNNRRVLRGLTADIANSACANDENLVSIWTR